MQHGSDLGLILVSITGRRGLQKAICMHLNSCQEEFVLEVRLLSNSVIKAFRWKVGGSEWSPANFAETRPFGGSFLLLLSSA